MAMPNFTSLRIKRDSFPSARLTRAAELSKANRSDRQGGGGWPIRGSSRPLGWRCYDSAGHRATLRVAAKRASKPGYYAALTTPALVFLEAATAGCFFPNRRIGAAIAIEEYVPINMPIKRTKVKPWIA